MLPSARRLTGRVATGRFDWQPPLRTAELPPLGPVECTPAGERSGHPFAEPRDILLPSAIAERTRAIEREMFAKGYAEAERVCEEAAAARLDPVLRRLSATIDDVAVLGPEFMRRAERDVVRLALAIARRILHRELDHDPDLLVTLARVAIDRLGEHVVATIHLNPEDFAATAASRTSRAGQAVTVVADPAVPRGGCRVHSDVGVIDTGIDPQVRELARALLGDEPEKDSSDGVAVSS